MSQNSKCPDESFSVNPILPAARITSYQFELKPFDYGCRALSAAVGQGPRTQAPCRFRKAQHKCHPRRGVIPPLSKCPFGLLSSEAT